MALPALHRPPVLGASPGAPAHTPFLPGARAAPGARQKCAGRSHPSTTDRDWQTRARLSALAGGHVPRM